jgi:hypothetical protein
MSDDVQSDGVAEHGFTAPTDDINHGRFFPRKIDGMRRNVFGRANFPHGIFLKKTSGIHAILWIAMWG